MIHLTKSLCVSIVLLSLLSTVAQPVSVNCPARCFCASLSTDVSTVTSSTLTERPQSLQISSVADLNETSLPNVQRSNTTASGPIRATVSGAIRINCRNRRIVGLTEIRNNSENSVEDHLVPSDVIIMDLSANLMTSLENGSFVDFAFVTVLNLSRNHINHIEPGSFIELNFLTSLDLSNNRLSALHRETFEGLEQLATLQLAGNPIKTLPEGIFDVDMLPVLVDLDLSSTLLSCDCQLRWLETWLSNSTTSSAKINNRSVCASPQQLSGRPLVQLTPFDFNCDWQTTPSQLSINPSVDQLVFVGDPLTLTCVVTTAILISEVTSESGPPPIAVGWSLNGTLLDAGTLSAPTPGQSRAARRQVSILTLKQSGSELQPSTMDQLRTIVVVTSVINITQLNWDDAGTWTCEFQSGNTRRELGLSLTVANRKFTNLKDTTSGAVEKKVSYCLPTLIETATGQYLWPRTQIGRTRRLPCAGTTADRSYPRSKSDSRLRSPAAASASYRCVSPGRWIQLDLSQCQHANVFTRVLARLASEMYRGSSSLAVLASRFRSVVGDGHKLTQPTDVDIVTTVVEHLSKLIRVDNTFYDVVLNVVSAVSSLPEPLLRISQQKHRACTRLIESMEAASKQLAGVNDFVVKSAANILVLLERFFTDSGVTCTVQRSLGAGRRCRDDFRCDGTTAECLQEVEGTDQSFGHVDKTTDILLHIPVKLVNSRPLSTNLRNLSVDETTSYNNDVVVIFYRTGKLFQLHNASKGVLTTIIVRSRPELYSNQIQVTTRLHHNHFQHTESKAVIWDNEANDGFGSWSSEGCVVHNETDSHLTFSCSHLGSVAVIQVPRSKPTKNWLNHIIPVVHVGTAILATSLAISLWYWSSTKRSKLTAIGRHQTSNVCLAGLLLCVVYFVHITSETSESTFLCWILYSAVQFLTMSLLIWLTMAIKSLKKVMTSFSNHDVINQPSQKPQRQHMCVWSNLMPYYVIGWGVPLAVSAACGAIQWNMSPSKYICFPDVRQMSPYLLFYLSAALLVAYDTINCIQICCLVYSISLISQKLRLYLQTTFEMTNDDKVRSKLCPALLNESNTSYSSFSFNSGRLLAAALLTGVIVTVLTWISGAALSKSLYYATVNEDAKNEVRNAILLAALYCACACLVGAILLTVTAASFFKQRNAVASKVKVDVTDRNDKRCCINWISKSTAASGAHATSVEQRNIGEQENGLLVPTVSLVDVGVSSCVHAIKNSPKVNSDSKESDATKNSALKSLKKKFTDNMLTRNCAEAFLHRRMSSVADADVGPLTAALPVGLQSHNDVEHCRSLTQRPSTTVGGQTSTKLKSQQLLELRPQELALTSSTTVETVEWFPPVQCPCSCTGCAPHLMTSSWIPQYSPTAVSRYSVRLRDFDDESIAYSDDELDSNHEMSTPLVPRTGSSFEGSLSNNIISCQQPVDYRYQQTSDFDASIVSREEWYHQHFISRSKFKDSVDDDDSTNASEFACSLSSRKRRPVTELCPPYNTDSSSPKNIYPRRLTPRSADRKQRIRSACRQQTTELNDSSLELVEVPSSSSGKLFVTVKRESRSRAESCHRNASVVAPAAGNLDVKPRLSRKKPRRTRSSRQFGRNKQIFTISAVFPRDPPPSPASEVYQSTATADD